MICPPRPTTNRCPPALNFVPAGDVQTAELIFFTPPFINVHKKRRGKRAEGLRYERAVQERFDADYGEFFLPSPWLRFTATHTEEKLRYCQPDGLFFDFAAGILTIVEVKLKHVAAAWWQTRHLYEPVVRKLFPPNLWQINVCEVVRRIDPHTIFPERFNYAQDIADVPRGAFGVHVLRLRTNVKETGR